MRTILAAFLLLVTTPAFASESFYEQAVKDVIQRVVINELHTIHVTPRTIIKVDRVFPSPRGRWIIRERETCYADWNNGGTRCY